MKNLRQAVVRVGIVGAITVTQIGAALEIRPRGRVLTSNISALTLALLMEKAVTNRAAN
jgi:hypothetical protein